MKTFSRFSFIKWLLFSLMVLCANCAPRAEEKTASSPAAEEDYLRNLQNEAIRNNKSPLGYWGNEPDNYTAWGTHSNRLIPIFTYGTKISGAGVNLDSYMGENSAYRSRNKLRDIYDYVPKQSLNKQAMYCDQTNLADLQFAALKAGKKYIFLVVFDGMDWQTIRNAAIWKSGKVGYSSGRGTGLHFQDYQANKTTQFGYMVAAPQNSSTKGDIKQQTVSFSLPIQYGGYNSQAGGATPWEQGNDGWYLMGLKSKDKKAGENPYPDSSSTASSMCSGIKTFNGAVNVDAQGNQVYSIAHSAQNKGYGIGAVSSVPISHATPAASYAHNVSRGDYHNLSRDMLGLPSVAHPKQPLSGLDVLIGCGHGVMRNTKRVTKTQPDGKVETTLQPENIYLAGDDLKKIDLRQGGKYTVAIRTPSRQGRELLFTAAQEAVKQKTRLFGMFGISGYKPGHLPFQTANGDYQPTVGRSNKAEQYTPADIKENPTLAEMTSAAIVVLSQKKRGFWLMVEAGDVDWANHDNNIDNSIGAVLSGDDAVKVITRWVEEYSNWEESLMIITADHGHYFHLTKPELLLMPK